MAGPLRMLPAPVPAAGQVRCCVCWGGACGMLVLTYNLTTKYRPQLAACLPSCIILLCACCALASESGVGSWEGASMRPAPFFTILQYLLYLPAVPRLHSTLPISPLHSFSHLISYLYPKENMSEGQ